MHEISWSIGCCRPRASAPITPPGYMALAGIAGGVGRALDLHDPDHLGQLVNAIAVVGTGVIVLLLARMLWPARPVTWVASVGFFAFLPYRGQDRNTMFHPEPLGMLVTGSTARTRAHGPGRRRTPGRLPWRSMSFSGQVSWYAPGRSGW